MAGPDSTQTVICHTDRDTPRTCPLAPSCLTAYRACQLDGTHGLPRRRLWSARTHTCLVEEVEEDEALLLAVVTAGKRVDDAPRAEPRQLLLHQLEKAEAGGAARAGGVLQAAAAAAPIAQGGGTLVADATPATPPAVAVAVEAVTVAGHVGVVVAEAAES